MKSVAVVRCDVLASRPTGPPPSTESSSRSRASTPRRATTGGARTRSRAGGTARSPSCCSGSPCVVSGPSGEREGARGHQYAVLDHQLGEWVSESTAIRIRRFCRAPCGRSGGPVGSRADVHAARVEMGTFAVVVEDRDDLHRPAVGADGVRDHRRELCCLAGLHQDRPVGQLKCSGP